MSFPVVIPAQAGIQKSVVVACLDTGLRRYDGRYGEAP